MASLDFMAVQCVQCSTMQVKQQKKSNNKWICAVCNQKQSVTRVFARGPRAKDVRLFVQGFNMSKGSTMEDFVDEEPEKCRDVLEEVYDRNKRTDWSEYLDSTVGAGDVEGNDDGEVKFVTEIPNNMRKKKRLSPKRLMRGISGDGNENPRVKKTKTMITTGSKWDEYLEQKIHEPDVLDAENLLGVADNSLIWGNDGAEYQPRDFAVEEEVHPDFV